MPKSLEALEQSPTFEGRTVAASAVRVTGAGDGLSEALALEPMELHHDQEVYLVIAAKVVKVTHEPVPKADGLLRRVHVVKASEVTFVDAADVKPFLDAERDRVLRLKEEQAGVSRLPDVDPLNVFAE